MDDTSFLICGDKYDRQCGEVFITLEGMILFHCTLCEKKFKGFNSYGAHLIAEHYKPKLQELTTEDLWPKTIEVVDNKNEDEKGTEYNKKDSKQTTFTNTEEKIQCSDTKANSKLNSKINQSNNSTSNIPKWKQYSDIIICPTTNEQRYKCKFCNVTLSDKSNVTNHVKRLHELIRPHKCDKCDKSFFMRNELKIHFRDHTGERPYLCMECGKAFETTARLSSHRSHNHIYRIRDKICPICQKAFTKTDKLRRHQKIVHVEERSFVCEICKTAFKCKPHLKNHMVIHENKREFRCNLCPAQYNYKYGLNLHVKTKHSVVCETQEINKLLAL